MEWQKTQLAKIGIISTDSANAAIFGRNKLQQEIKTASGDSSQVILQINCGMHAG